VGTNWGDVRADGPDPGVACNRPAFFPAHPRRAQVLAGPTSGPIPCSIAIAILGDGRGTAPCAWVSFP